MKPMDLVQLVLGIIVGAYVLHPDIAGIPSPAAKEVEWPREVKLTKDENKEAGETSRRALQLLCRGKYCSNNVGYIFLFIIGRYDNKAICHSSWVQCLLCCLNFIQRQK